MEQKQKEEIAELLQAIDSCSQDNCSNCPYYVGEDNSVCVQHLFAMAYDTILELSGKKV